MDTRQDRMSLGVPSTTPAKNKEKIERADARKVVIAPRRSIRHNDGKLKPV